MFALLTDAQISAGEYFSLPPQPEWLWISIKFPWKGHIKIKHLKLVIPPTSAKVKNVRSFMSKYQHDINCTLYSIKRGTTVWLIAS
jgi:hypothetical protein